MLRWSTTLRCEMSVTIRSTGERYGRPVRRATENIKRILLMRNGESQANVNIAEYVHTPDWKISLTEKGREDCVAAGRDLAALLDREPVYFYFSPYIRSIESLHAVMQGAAAVRKLNIVGVREDARLRDSDMGRYDSVEELKKCLAEREQYGKFFYRFPHGESGADVCDRVSSFLEAFQREKQLFPMNTNIVILTHGLTIRMFVKRWFHLSVDTFHLMHSPPTSCPIHLLRRDARTGSFRLTDECMTRLHLPSSLNRDNGYEFRNKQLLGSVSTGAPFL